jgi:LCP family protein required for cell wall assembly
MATTDRPVPDGAGAGHGGSAARRAGAALARLRSLRGKVSHRTLPHPPPRRSKTPGPKTARSRTPLWARLCVIFGAVLVLVSGSTIAAVKVLANRYERAVHRAELIAPDAREDVAPEQTTTITGPLNYLLIGSDSRAGLPHEGQRADTIIVVHVPRALNRAYLISIPRDLLVRIPAFRPTSFGGAEEKINGAYEHGGGGLGGAQLLSATLTELIGIRFNGAAIIDFEGFKRAVNILGGVYLCVDTTVESNHLGVDRNGRLVQLWADAEGTIQGLPPGGRPYVFKKGCQRMNGALALDYARIRYGLPAGDFDRQRHQQQFLKAMLAEATKDGVATNPIKFDQFIRAVGSALTVDTGEVSLVDLAFGLRNVTPSTFVGVRVPSGPQDLGGVSYVLPEPSAASLYRAIREDALDEWVDANPEWVNSLR